MKLHGNKRIPGKGLIFAGAFLALIFFTSMNSGKMALAMGATPSKSSHETIITVKKTDNTQIAQSVRSAAKVGAKTKSQGNVSDGTKKTASQGSKNTGTERADKSIDLERLTIPKIKNGDIIIEHTGFTLSYNEKHEQANWVAYVLTDEEARKIVAQRNENFREDPDVPTGSATLDDYRRSGYDRGHLAPAADFRWSETALDETFLLSNMSPQDREFNKGIWNDLEMAVRVYAKRFKKICVVTGPVLTDGPYKTIGQNKVSVPKYYYKVILDYSDPELKAIGFIIPNEGSDEDFYKYACSVDDVEKATGIDFFYILNDRHENMLEGTFDINLWK